MKTLHTLPPYNEADNNIAEVLRRRRPTVPAADILVIDDASSDARAAIALTRGAMLGGVVLMRVGTRKWTVGEEIRRSLQRPSDTMPGVDRMKLRAWLSATGKQLWIRRRICRSRARSVEIRTLTVVGPSQTDRSVIWIRN